MPIPLEISYFSKFTYENFELLLTKMRISNLTEKSCFHHCLQINNLGGNGTALTSACSPPATSTSAVTRQIKVSTLFFIEIYFRAKLQMLLMTFVILPLLRNKTLLFYYLVAKLFCLINCFPNKAFYQLLYTAAFRREHKPIR